MTKDDETYSKLYAEHIKRLDRNYFWNKVVFAVAAVNVVACVLLNVAVWVN